MHLNYVPCKGSILLVLHFLSVLSKQISLIEALEEIVVGKNCLRKTQRLTGSFFFMRVI